MEIVTSRGLRLKHFLVWFLLIFASKVDLKNVRILTDQIFFMTLKFQVFNIRFSYRFESLPILEFVDFLEPISTG